MEKQNNTKQNLLRIMFNGRLCRRNYLYGTMVFYLLMFVIAGIVWFVLTLAWVIFGFDLKFIFPIIISPPWILFALSLLVRRHHDLNQSWRYAILVFLGLIVLGVVNASLVSPVGGLYSLYLFIAKGSEENNRFGPPDKSKGILKIVGLRQ